MNCSASCEVINLGADCPRGDSPYEGGGKWEDGRGKAGRQEETDIKGRKWGKEGRREEENSKKEGGKDPDTIVW